MWDFWIDVGGTFTDCIAHSPDGRVQRLKVLSSGLLQGRGRIEASRPAVLVDAQRRDDPRGFWRGVAIELFSTDGASLHRSRVAAFDHTLGELLLFEPPRIEPELAASDSLTYQLDPELEAPLLAMRLAVGSTPSDVLPPARVRLGTTRGTNALLTRGGADTAWITTRGFADLPLIGHQDRPHLFDLDIRKPPPLFAVAAEIDERIDAAGNVVRPLDAGQARHALQSVWSQAARSLAICLLNAYRNPQHELRLAELAREIGFEDIALSHRVSPLMGMIARGDTCIVDAYLNPVLTRYVRRIEQRLGPGSDLRLLTSTGGLSRAASFTGKDSILSGPAGGVIGYARCARAAGFATAIGFDMGGTSTDVSRYAGSLELQYETRKAGVRLAVPMMAIETVAAGGGSICEFDGDRLFVGPASAGAVPGPRCYGRGGPLTITDCNVLLGRLPAAEFPFPLDVESARRAMSDLAERVARASGRAMTAEQLAAGFIEIADQHMEQAVRAISLARGYRPADHVLAPFGGAAGQHACSIASRLGITRILAHPDAGLLSAYGIGLADIARHAAAPCYEPLDPQRSSEFERRFQALEDQVRAALTAEGAQADRVELTREAQLRYRGLDAALVVDASDLTRIADLYAQAHQQLHGYQRLQAPIELVALRVAGVARQADLLPPSRPLDQHFAASPLRTDAPTWFDGRWQPTALYRDEQCPPGARIIGPGILLHHGATTVIAPGWQAERWSGGEWLLQRVLFAGAPPGLLQRDGAIGESPGDSGDEEFDSPADPLWLELFRNHFAAIAEQMGVTLRNTATSVNVKERLDFSCALFTSRGELVVNAPHIPVHLGAMSETVRWVAREVTDLAPGDAVVTNDPFQGGSHLPDVTVVTPVFRRMEPDVVDPGPLLFFTASRAHHAEMGGVTPGSMPPHSRNLAEEGVLIRNFRVLARFQPRYDAMRRLLANAPYPSRNPDENIADIQAQVSANLRGARDLLGLCDAQGLDRVQAYMKHIQAASREKVRQALRQLGDGRRDFVDYMDDGSPIRVAITISQGNCTIDFTGSAPVSTNNLNANRAIVSAAVMYCLRCMLKDDTPLNQGVLDPVRLILDEGLLNPKGSDDPRQCPAVVGGNVETSQRVVDVLLGALDLAAASQGTMNNLTFGDDRFGYYETICGGAGAVEHADGADAVHTHMTNTRLTDPEVVEHRFPVRLWEFSIRRGSGGPGRHRGGDGVVRRFEFLKELRVALLTQRRGPYAPYGKHGGEPGSLGENRWLPSDGPPQTLPAAAQIQARPGDQLELRTPGGGGWGVSPGPRTPLAGSVSKES